MAPRRMETKPVIFCLKTLLLLYCLIFWVVCVLLLTCVGLWWASRLGPSRLLISTGQSNAPYVLSATGGAIVLFGLFGCFAPPCKGPVLMLKLYAVFLSLVFITELIAGISGFVFRHEV
ncbi:tetraspanin-7-like [Perca fluviatilis]|uniref:tetraspanin-7-like n=1 Tax=Perca fluviatilis TaxID=8168 RepID=UPI001963E286|nr:tetraspanin-7-like [Perca fluviatilis]